MNTSNHKLYKTGFSRREFFKAAGLTTAAFLLPSPLGFLASDEFDLGLTEVKATTALVKWYKVNLSGNPKAVTSRECSLPINSEQALGNASRNWY